MSLSTLQTHWGSRPVVRSVLVVSTVHVSVAYGNQIANQYLSPPQQTFLGIAEITAGRRLLQHDRSRVGVGLLAHGFLEGIVGGLRWYRAYHRNQQD